MILNNLYLFKRNDAGMELPVPEEQKKTAEKKDDVIYCKACGNRICTEQDRITINDAHIHTCSNPSGYVYTFGCFRDAPGCLVLGKATSEHTWFSGYEWCISVCNHCNEHMGWIFVNADSFYALITERLTSQH